MKIFLAKKTIRNIYCQSTSTITVSAPAHRCCLCSRPGSFGVAKPTSNDYYLLRSSSLPPSVTNIPMDSHIKQ